MHRFYPGVAAPSRPLLGPGPVPGTIDSPEQPASDVYDQVFDVDDIDTHDSSSPRQGKWSSARGNAYAVTSLSPSSGRAPKVVGSFDHAILPMPPVRISHTSRWFCLFIILYRERLSFLRWIFSRAMLLQ